MAARGDTWAGLGRLLVKDDAEEPIGEQWRFQGLEGVVRQGNDPRALICRIPTGGKPEEAPTGWEIVERHPSGRFIPGETSGEKISYWQRKIDLAKRGERRLEGSTAWFDCWLYAFITPQLPPLEIVRIAISQLMSRLGLVNPTLEQYRACTSEAEFQILSGLSAITRVKRYRLGLVPLANSPSAHSISLLAALAIESFITNDDVLLELHRDALSDAIDRLFENDLMQDVRGEFDQVISRKVLGMVWSPSPPDPWTHVSSPLMSLKDWHRMSAVRDHA